MSMHLLFITVLFSAFALYIHEVFCRSVINDDEIIACKILCSFFVSKRQYYSASY